MAEESKVMIAKTDRGKDRLHIKVRRRMKNAFAPDEYNKIVNTRDANDIALFFEDMSVIIGAPIEKAFRIYREKKDRGFPF
jgi:hypothetical protein